jgi:hypothetical protein
MNPLSLAVASVLIAGSITYIGGKLDSLVMWQQRTQTTLEMVCKQLEEKSGVDKRQDRELEQIRTHIRLPPP